MPAATLGAVFPHKNGREGLEEAVAHLYNNKSQTEKTDSIDKRYEPEKRGYEKTEDRR